MQASRQIFRATTVFVIAGTLFGSIFILSQEVHALQGNAMSISGPSMTFGDPQNPTCTVRLESLDGPLAAGFTKDLWKIIMACNAAQGGTPQPETLLPHPNRPFEIET